MPWSRHGLRIVGDVGNGRKALDFLREHPVDLLITDLAMPVMSGIELMRQARKLQPKLHMVVLTFHHEFEYAQEAIRLGALDYITKVELEEDQMDEVLQRIVRQIEDRGENEPKSTDKKEFQALKVSWRSFDWMVDDEKFARLLEELSDRRLSPERLEALFEASSPHWERAMPDLKPYLATEELHTWEQWVEWLKRIRQEVGESTRALPYSSEVVHCIRKAQEYIHAYLEEELQMPAIAKTVNMSRSYFSRCFHEIAGTTFHEYIRDLRIKRAKSLLRQSDKSIGWIAVQSGYPNVKYFSKVFRDATGQLPSAYRKEDEGSK